MSADTLLAFMGTERWWTANQLAQELRRTPTGVACSLAKQGPGVVERGVCELTGRTTYRWTGAVREPAGWWDTDRELAA